MNQLTPSLPINDLSTFLDQVSNLFDNMVYSWSQILFADSNRMPITEAWEELKPSVPSLKVELTKPTVTTKLKEAGLDGKQLVLKLKGLSDAWKKFWEKGTVRLLKKLLDWINTIMKSLVTAIPGGEALKELKEAMEKSIDDDE